MDIIKVFGANLKKYYVTMGISQEAFADKCGMHRTYISVYICDSEGAQYLIQIAIKWLFMEQDCAYWNYSGRRMMFEGLSKLGLV